MGAWPVVNWRLWWEQPPTKSWVSLATSSDTLTGLSIDVHSVFGGPDRGCVATSCFRYIDVPVTNVHCHRFKRFFVFFWFRFACDTKHAAFAPFCCTCTCEESDSSDISVRENDYVCWSHHQSISLSPDSRPGWNCILSSSTTDFWLLWDFLRSFVGSFWGVSSIDFG